MLVHLQQWPRRGAKYIRLLYKLFNNQNYLYRQNHINIISCNYNVLHTQAIELV